MHVLVIGAGIGGLCLAHGLRRAGIGVTVYERDASASEWLAGYRIHVNARGSGALRECLPPHLWDTFVASAALPGAGIGFMTEQLCELKVLPGAGHACQLEQPWLFDRLMIEFLDKHGLFPSGPKPLPSF